MRATFHRTLLILLASLLCLTVILILPENHVLVKEKFKISNDTAEEKPIDLLNKVRVLCWIMTSPTNRLVKAAHVQNTWGKRCDKLLLMSSRTDNQTENVIALPVDEGRENLWRKTRAAFQYVFDNHFDDADWFMKADDDTYVVMDNLRYMLYQYLPSYPIFFGHRFAPYYKQGYMAGASYVLSKEALVRFMNDPAKESPCNENNTHAEDMQIGACMEAVDVVAGDSRDEYKSERYFPLEPEFFMQEKGFGIAPWLPKYLFYKSTEHIDTVSDTAIAFHYIRPELMYMYEYFIYHMEAIEAKVEDCSPSDEINFEDLLKEKAIQSNKV